MVKTLLLKGIAILRQNIITGAKSCNCESSELYISFDFQAETLHSLFPCFTLIVLNVGWETNIFCEPSSPVKNILPKKKFDICWYLFYFFC